MIRSISSVLVMLLSVLGLFQQRALAAAPSTKPHVAVVAGYPAPDAPLFEFGFRERGATVDMFDKEWLPVEQFSKYNVVVMTASLKRAQANPSSFSADDIKKLQTFLQNGGTLLITHSAVGDVFREPEGRAFLESVLGKAPPREKKDAVSVVMQPNHPWVKHLSTMGDLTWLTSATYPLYTTKGEKIIGNENRMALGRFKIGSGQIIYLGWNIEQFMPHGRNLKSTVEDEQRYEAQYKVFQNIAAELIPSAESK